MSTPTAKCSAPVFDPVSIKVQNPVAHTGALHLAVGVDTYLSTQVQEKVPATPELEALPPLEVLSAIQGKYKLALPLRVSTEDVNELLKELDGQEFTFKAKGKTISTKLVKGRVYTNGPDLVAYVEVKTGDRILGFIPVHVGAYFNGTPQYSTDSRTLYVDPFDYDADTNLLLLDKAEWFFHGTIREKLQETLRLSIGDELDELHHKLGETIRELAIGDYIVLKGTVENLSPRAIYTTDKTLNVDTLATGSAKVEVQ